MDEVRNKLLRFENDEAMRIEADWYLIFGYWNNFLITNEYGGIETINQFLAIYHRSPPNKAEIKKYNDTCDLALEHIQKNK